MTTLHATPGLMPLAYPDDAGLDLVTATTVVCEHGRLTWVPTEVVVALPSGTWGMIAPRSSTTNRGLLVPIGVIDAGYRGPLSVPVFNLSGGQFTAQAGERLAQLIVLPAALPRVLTATREELPASATRGVNGFGSTGRT